MEENRIERIRANIRKHNDEIIKNLYEMAKMRSEYFKISALLLRTTADIIKMENEAMEQSLDEQIKKKERE